MKDENYYKSLDKRTKEYKDWKANQSEGLGDDIENILKKTGIKKLVETFTPEGKDCGCEERKNKLNKLQPRARKVINCMTEEQYKQYGEFIKTRTLNSWQNEEKLFLLDLYKQVFAVFYNPKDICSSCTGSARIMSRITDELDKVYETYENN